MNITSGQSAVKQHLMNGSKTYCNRKTSGIGANDYKSFEWAVENHIHICCKKCLNTFNEKKNRINKTN
jgi:hypothetical protein